MVLSGKMDKITIIMEVFYLELLRLIWTRLAFKNEQGKLIIRLHKVNEFPESKMKEPEEYWSMINDWRFWK